MFGDSLLEFFYVWCWGLFICGLEMRRIKEVFYEKEFRLWEVILFRVVEG